MTDLVILGTANAVPDKEHENTHMALQGKDAFVLIDCVNNPVVRLQQAGLDILRLSDLILTHFHPDHVSGVPSLLMSSWLLGRTAPLDIYGLAHTLDRIEGLMDYYEWKLWPRFFPVRFHRLPEEELTPVLDNDEFRIFASPVRHLIPTIGLRVEFSRSGKVLAYSCDTEPCPQVVRLASGADALVHEATGAGRGHSSAAQAGVMAHEAEVGKLYLIHYPANSAKHQGLIAEAQMTFGGPVELAFDFMRLPF